MSFLSYKSGGIVLYHTQMASMPLRAAAAAKPTAPLKFRETDLNSNSITAEVVEDLANVLKDNMRLNAIHSSKTRSYISRKSSRASPYRIPMRCSGGCDKIPCLDCEHKHRNSSRFDSQDDPYELLQKLIKSGNLVNEAVRRLNISFTLPPKSKQFYESDDDNSCSPKRYNVSYENPE